MSDQPDIPLAGSFTYDNERVIDPTYAVDPNARFQNVFKYINNTSAASKFNSGNLTDVVPRVEKNLTDYVKWNPGRMIGNEGQTYEHGDWSIDETKLPKATLPWSKEALPATALAPAFTNQESLDAFKKDPVGYVNDLKKQLGPKYQGFLPYLVPQYDKNYGWVVSRSAGNSIATDRYNNTRGAKVSNLMVNTVLPAVASMGFGALGMPTLAMQAIQGARAIGGGADWKQVALNVAASAAGNYLGNAAGGGLTGQLIRTGINLGKGLLYPSANPISASGPINRTSRLQYPIGG